MNKSKALTSGLLLILAGLAVCAWLMFGSTEAGMKYANEDKYTVGSTTVSEPVESLYVDWTSGLVTVEYHAGEGVIISETANREMSEDDRLRWWLDGTTLRIRYAKSGFRLSLNLEKKLTVSLPEGTVLKGADISSTSADLNIPGLAADEIRLDSTSGDINAVTVTGKLTASSTSGNIDVRQGNDIGDVVLGSTSGSISCVLGANAASVSANSTSGAIGLTVSGSIETVRLDSTSGSLYPDLASVGSAEFSSTSGCFKGTVAAFRDMKIGTTSGDVTVALAEDPGFTCRVGTSGGSFSSGLALTKDGDAYSCGSGEAHCSINTSSGNIRIDPVK